MLTKKLTCSKKWKSYNSRHLEPFSILFVIISITFYLILPSFINKTERKKEVVEVRTVRTPTAL